jgi:hypothetical protein
VPAPLVEALGSLGLSSICNVLAAIKMAKYLRLGPQQAVLTVATDGAEMYRSVVDEVVARRFAGGFDAAAAAETMGRHLLGAATDNLIELTEQDRRRIFNLGYFTWVEQQGVSIEEFVARRDLSFWVRLHELIPAWDEMIREFNGRTGMAAAS